MIEAAPDKASSAHRLLGLLAIARLALVAWFLFPRTRTRIVDAASLTSMQDLALDRLCVLDFI